ncbi:DNA repair protein rad2 [Ceratocystis pirilliformis]|uniref:DNA repair protein rad2 n=1 Tax=Ceratocystis pirilliformis TaxID=259994 RepID=A0ABR3ZF60_9PEZI
MGVTGLWQVVQPCARPTNIATLNRKRLAVDASIWIYQFLKAVRDKEGNALNSSHVVGFFRRICKLLWFGILPVFVFDGGAPVLKRQTIQNRRQRREGRREDASRTAGKLLTVKMQRLAHEEAERQKKRRRSQNKDQVAEKQVDQEEPEIDFQNAVYVDEIGLSPQERLRKRKFVKQDPYHLPYLEGGVGARANPEDPRIMSVEELEEYARQFNAGEDVDLYDFSNIDFDGDFFQSLPAADRYYILNAARLRSRLRMGLDKEQLEIMFPDRMAFSRFQVERVQERNNLTQRLMKELGMTGLDLTVDGGRRIAGDKNREYILVKNDSAEGGWALGIVNRDKDIGKAHKPIDVDALQFEFQGKDGYSDEGEVEDFEDVPIEGLNRLPKTRALAARALQQSQTAPLQDSAKKKKDEEGDGDEDEGLFVSNAPLQIERGFPENQYTAADKYEQDDIDIAIALALETQHKAMISTKVPAYEEIEPNDNLTDVPVWKQKAVEMPQSLSRPITKSTLNTLNQRANIEVSNPSTREVAQPKPANDSDSDSDMDFHAALAMSRKAHQHKPATAPLPMISMKVNKPSSRSLPFPKLDWTAKKKIQSPKKTPGPPDEGSSLELGGGFVPDSHNNDKPNNELPPWMLDDTDIIESLKKQEEAQRQMDTKDRDHALSEQQFYGDLRSRQADFIEVLSDSDSEIELVDAISQRIVNDKESIPSTTLNLQPQPANKPPLELDVEHSKQDSPEPEFEDVVAIDTATNKASTPESPRESSVHEFEIDDEELFGKGAQNSDNEDSNLDDFSDLEDEQLLIQMAEEAEEHARFANQVQNRPEGTNHASIEAELRQLRDEQRRERRDADEVTETMGLQCQDLLRLFGIPFITAPMEAEAQCAELVRLGLVDGIITDDSDTFLFGGTRVYKNMFNTNKFVECYITSDLETEMSLDRDSLISLALLLGSDYTEGLPGVGPVTAVEILSEFPGKDGLEKFKEWWEDVQLHNRPHDADKSAFRRKFRKSHLTKLFLPASFPSKTVYDAYIRPEVDDSDERFQWGVPDLDGLRKFLMTTTGWSQDRTDEVLVPVIRDMNRREREGTQSNITKYFQGGVGAGARDAFAPRQRVQGSKRMAKAVDRLKQAVTGEITDESSAPGNATTTSTKRKRPEKTVQRIDDESEGYKEGEGEDPAHNDDYQAVRRRRKASRKASQRSR